MKLKKNIVWIGSLGAVLGTCAMLSVLDKTPLQLVHAPVRAPMKDLTLSLGGSFGTNEFHKTLVVSFNPKQTNSTINIGRARESLSATAKIMFPIFQLKNLLADDLTNTPAR